MGDGQPYTKLPYVRRYQLQPGEDRLPLWSGAWERASAHAFVLESGKGGRYTILGLRPEAVIRGKGKRAQLTTLGGLAEAGASSTSVGGCAESRLPPADATAGPAAAFADAAQPRSTPATETLEAAPLDAVRGWLRRHQAPLAPEAPPFAGGCVGFWGYDVARSLERLPELAKDDLGLPDYAFLLMDELWVVDHVQQTLYCCLHAPIPVSRAGALQAYEAAAARAETMKRTWDNIAQAASSEAARAAVNRMEQAVAKGKLADDAESSEGIRTATAKEDFERAVRRIQQYIAQGDVFQANLSLRMSRTIQSSPEELYEWLRRVNPSPYMSFLRFPDFQFVSASPELLVKLDGGRMSTRPIAGTRRRGRTPEEDAAMESELLASEKERAEHIMLVDLERNDLGRVAAYGSVKVPELLTVERYSHVMHLVSQVEGRLAHGKDAFDVLGAVFPGGTITGAPKIRTMEIIEELEPVRRGPYTGSLGWIDYAGNMEFNIIIRTMAVKDGICHIQAGAGIVIDSDPQREFHECMNKAKALWLTVQYGERQCGEA
ncbi:aminodeoxychorismate synthase component I [Cohnella lubricantis]|nr:aminodeoxychorismate synthase component I [Cohnella lubricantis]